MFKVSHPILPPAHVSLSKIHRPIFGQTTEEIMKNAPMCNGLTSTDKGQSHDFMENWWCHQNPELAGGLTLLALTAYLGQKQIRKVFKSIKSKIGLKRTS